MRGFLEALAEIEIRALPAAIGAAVFLSLQLLTRVARSHSKARQALQKKLHDDAEWCVRCGDEEGCPRCEELLPEPAPEPAAEAGEPTARRSPATALKRALRFAIALLLLPVFLHCCGLGFPPGRGSSPEVPAFQTAPVPVVEQTDGSVGSEVGIGEPEVQSNSRPQIIKDTLHSPPVALNSSVEMTEPVVVNAESGTMGCSESMGHVEAAPFSIKLHRQAFAEGQDDYVRSAYYGTVKVGTPAMDMTVVFDTGSGHLILPSMYCHSETCSVHRRYRRSGSITGRDIGSDGKAVQVGTAREALTVAFGTGQVTGVLVEDIVCLGRLVSTNTSWELAHGEHGAGCVKFSFIAATSLSEDPFKRFNFDGVLGLGLTGLSQTLEFNFMHVFARSMEDLGSRPSTTFGVFLATTVAEDSEIALGGWSKEHLTEDLSWNRVDSPEMGHWILPIRRIRVDGYAFDICNDGTCRAAVDTGTSLLSVPTGFFRELYHMLLHPAPLSGNCKGHGPMIHIELERSTVSLGPREYAEAKVKKHPSMPEPDFHGGDCANCTPIQRLDLQCQPMLMTLDLPEELGPKLFILGEPVLRKYYTVYDAEKVRIGIGRAKHRSAMTRDELLTVAPDLYGRTSAVAGKASRTGRQSRPTMFDIFRWRRAASLVVP